VLEIFGMAMSGWAAQGNAQRSQAWRVRRDAAAQHMTRLVATLRGAARRGLASQGRQSPARRSPVRLGAVWLGLSMQARCALVWRGSAWQRLGRTGRSRHGPARRDLSGTGSTLSGMAGHGNAGGASQRRTPCGAASLRSSRIGMAMQARSGPVGSGLARFVAVGSVAAMQAWRGLAHTGEARLDVLWRCMSSQRPARRGNAGGVARCWDRFAPVRQGDAGAASCSNATRGIVGHGNAGIVGLVAARSDTFGSGFAVSGTARRGDAGLVRLGLARLGSTERGAVGRRRHGTARRGRSGQCEIEPDRASHGWAMQARRVRASVEGHRPERRRTARQPRLGCVLPVSARHDLARQRRRSNARQVLSRHGPFLQRSKRHGNAGSVRAMIGNAGYRWVRLGVATQARSSKVRRGSAGHCSAVPGNAGTARLCMTGQRDARIGEAASVRLGPSLLGPSGNGGATQCRRGLSRTGVAQHGSARLRQAWRGIASSVIAGSVTATLVLARLGNAVSARPGLGRHRHRETWSGVVRLGSSTQACIENSVARGSDSVSTFYAPPLLLKENG
jgi:hypothetical protein